MYDKTKLFNLALSALFLQKRITNADTDTSVEGLTLQVNWDTAYYSALSDLDLDSTSTIKVLSQLVINPNEHWAYAYLYPTDCAYFRRILSSNVKDDAYTTIDRKIGIHSGQKVIFTNQQAAYGEYVIKDVPMASLTPEAAIYVSLKLASLCAPLIVGKNSDNVVRTIERRMSQALFDAQQKDNAETSIYTHDYQKSEFARERLS